MGVFVVVSSLTTIINQELESLTYSFQRQDHRFRLAVGDDVPGIYFAHTSKGTVGGGSRKWVARKHKNGDIHEPATVAAFLFAQRVFGDRIDVVFDIGALYGYFGLMSKALFPEAAVHSFEMNPASFGAMVINVMYNGHLGDPAVQCVNVGLTDRTQRDSRVSIENFKLDEQPDDSEGSLLDLVTLDDYCSRNNVAPDLMKIDVEGYQAKILPGAMEAIGKRRPVILMEFDGAQALEPFGCTNKSIVEPLFDLGYSLLWCDDQRGQGRFVEVQPGAMGATHEQNSLGVFVPS